MRRHVFLWTTVLFCALCESAITTSAGVKLAASQVASGLSSPLFATAPPGDTARLFIAEQAGRIKIMNLANATTNATPFLDIHTKITSGGETGLLGLAFHPDYSTNGYFYVDYTNTQGDTVIERYTVSTDPALANTNSAQIVLTIAQPAGNHNGGWIGFSPLDHYLYIAMGDGGGGCDTYRHSQVLANSNSADPTANLLGKMLRIDVNGDDYASTNQNYAIPPDNPYANTNGDDEVWAYGLRNPFRDSFDRATGDLWIGDVGQSAQEEIDFQPTGLPGGRNYGWPCAEGFASCTCGAPPTGYCICGDPIFVPPIVTYTHSLGCAIIGGYVYRGPIIPLRGTYFYSDNCQSTIRTFRYDGVNVTDINSNDNAAMNSSFSSISSFGEDANGELYVLSLTGKIHRFVRKCAVTIVTQPRSQHACLGTTVQLSVSVVGAVGNVTYTWLKNGATFGGTATPTIVLANVTVADSGTYRCDVQDTCDNVIPSDYAVIVVLDSGTGTDDCNTNGTADYCEGDCNTNDIADVCELLEVNDCNSNHLLDVCEGDCNTNATLDACEFYSTDCNFNGISDLCESLVMPLPDCNTNGSFDACDIVAGIAADGDHDGVLDICDNCPGLPNANQSMARDQTVEAPVSGQYGSLRLAPDGHIGLSYYQSTTNPVTGQLRFWNDSNTDLTPQPSEIVTIDASTADVGQFSSLDFLPDGTAMIASYDVSNHDLRFWFDSNRNFTAEPGELSTIDNSANVGQYCSLSHDPQSRITLAYFRVTQNALKVWHDTNGDHQPDPSEITLIDGIDDSIPGGQNTGLYCSLAFSPQGHAAISYYRLATHQLEYWIDLNDNFRGDTGEFSMYGSNNDIGMYTSLAFDSAGKATVVFYDATLHTILLWHDTNGDSQVDPSEVSTVVTANNMAQWPSLTFDSLGHPLVAFYRSVTNTLLLWRDTDGNFTSTTAEILRIPAVGEGGTFASLIFHPRLKAPMIAYQKNATQSMSLVIDMDWDSDNICYVNDNCPSVANPDQSDTDHDGIGDACACQSCSGDINADHRVDAADVAGWVRCMLASPQAIDNCNCRGGLSAAQFVDRLLHAANLDCP